MARTQIQIIIGNIRDPLARALLALTFSTGLVDAVS
jgi:hypothetical protein